MKAHIYFRHEPSCSVEFPKRSWFYAAREILLKEGLGHVQVFVEPNETVDAEEVPDNWFLRLIGWTKSMKLYGWYCNDDCTLHFTAGRDDYETLDTILHEIAHAKVHEHGVKESDHGPWWQFQFHLMKDLYRTELNRMMETKVRKVISEVELGKYESFEITFTEREFGVTRKKVVTIK